MSNVVRGALNTHIIYIDLASATAMKMASRSIALISQKTNFHVQPTLFFSNQQKKKRNLLVQHAFLLSLQLFYKTTMPFCATKTSNLPVTHFYGGIVECAYQRFCYLNSCSLLLFSLPLIFTWPQLLERWSI